jgi:hypothetical protein
LLLKSPSLAALIGAPPCPEGSVLLKDLGR